MVVMYNKHITLKSQNVLFYLEEFGLILYRFPFAQCDVIELELNDISVNIRKNNTCLGFF